jgi:2-dehydro-3-deoxygalactonokinase
LISKTDRNFRVSENLMSGSATPVLGIDWGTTNRRAYLLDSNGALVRRHTDDFGILKVAGNFENALKNLLAELDVRGADIILSGMVGSRNGWQQVPYLSVSQPVSALADAMVEIRTSIPEVRCRIVPGYHYVDPHGNPDVMRGEETQVLGALALSAADGWFLLPGTHSKWAWVEKGMIREFITFMTGEMYSLLSTHGTLASLMSEKTSIPVAFEAGVRAAEQGSFTHMVFCCRALVVTDAMPAAHASSYLSGLLIGTELQEIRRRTGTGDRLRVQMIGSPALEGRYVEAMEYFGMSARVWQPDQVYLAALRRLAGIKQ